MQNTDVYIIKGILSNYGYCIRKSQYLPVILSSIKTFFNVKPKTSFDETDKNDNSFDLYYEDDTYLVIPKFYSNSFINVKIYDEKNNIIYNKISFNITKIKYKYLPNNFTFSGKLRDYQMNTVNIVLNNFSLKLGDNGIIENQETNTPKGGILQLSVGSGKTVIAIYLACLLKLKTLIIVHQEFLQDQWIERFKLFTNAKIGIIRGNIIDIDDKDVVIGMLQSISMKDYEDHIFKQFGLVIYDEAHHLGSKVFSRTLMKTSSKYTLGLTATPEREDGLMKIIKWFCGDIIHKYERTCNYRVLVKKIHFRSNNNLFKEEKKLINGKVRINHNKILENLFLINTRNKLLINIIDNLKSRGRTVFVISHRLEHLQVLKKGVDALIKESNESHIYNTYYYVGKTTAGQKKLAEKEGNVIFATIQLASEALDIPRLDSIVLAFPIKAILKKKEKTLVQTIGRILRNETLDKLTSVPVVVDLCDILSIYKNWATQREELYCSKNWYMQNYYWQDEEYLYRSKDDKNSKPFNIMFDDIEDEDFIEKNLIVNENI